MKKIDISNVLLFAIVFLLVTSCNKDFVKENLKVSKKTETENLDLSLQAGSPTPPLDWENISFMPAPAGINIPVPWQGGLGGAKMDDDIIFDYHASDGWELVYNTFSATTTYDINYFMLYNKYRGVLRTYYYILPGGNYPSSNITHFLALTGQSASSSPLLKFASDDIVDFDTPSLNVSQLQPYQVSSSTGSWYAAEFEIAFDQDAANTPYEQLRMDWYVNSNSISSVVFNGISTGDLSGTIQNTSSSGDFFSNLVNGAIDGGLKIGSEKTAKTLGFIPSEIKDKLISAATNGIGGVVKGFLSGILGGTSSTTTQKVSLKINTNITISGQHTVEGQLCDNVFGIPGTQNVINTVPFYPKLTQPLGVFYLSNKPVVNEHFDSQLIEDDQGTNYYIYQSYDVDDNSFDIIFNDAVTSVANIENIRKEVLMYDWPTNSAVSIGGSREDVGDKEYYVAPSLSRLSPRPTSIPSGDFAIRIIFDVVPKDGSPKCTIVKTFAANKVRI